MDIDENLLNEIKTAIFDESSVQSEVKFNELMRETQDSINKLNVQSELLSNSILDMKQNFGEYEEEVSKKIDEKKLQIQKIQEFMKEPNQKIQSLLTENASNIKQLPNPESYKSVLDLSNLTISQNENYVPSELPTNIYEKSHELFDALKTSLYEDLQKLLSTFSVATHTALKQIFFNPNSPGAAQSQQFFTLIEYIKFDPSWAENVAICAFKVFDNRMKYHIAHADLRTESTYTGLTVALLKNSLQSGSIILSGVEKECDKKSVLTIFSEMLMQSAIDMISNSLVHNSLNTRSLFSEAAAFDEWLENVEFLIVKPLSATLFDFFGEEWIKLEAAQALSFTKSMIERPKDVLQFTTMLSGLYDLMPLTLDSEQQLSFYRGILLKVERGALRGTLEKVKNGPESGSVSGLLREIPNFCDKAMLANISSQKLNELYGLTDCRCPELKTDSELLRKAAEEGITKLSSNVASIFQTNAGEYFVIHQVIPSEGVSPGLSNAINVVSPLVSAAKSALDGVLFEGYFLPALQSRIDSIVYKGIAMGADFRREGAVDQFVRDVDALRLAFGGDDIRKCRSAVVILTQKEEQVFDCEISERDVEKLMDQVLKSS